MIPKELKNKIKEEIIKGRTKESIEALRLYANSKNYSAIENRCILLLADYQLIKDKIIIGILTTENEQVEWNKLNNKIIHLVDADAPVKNKLPLSGIDTFQNIVYITNNFMTAISQKSDNNIDLSGDSQVVFFDDLGRGLTFLLLSLILLALGSVFFDLDVISIECDNFLTYDALFSFVIYGFLTFGALFLLKWLIVKML